jgi:hypothetical protein
MAGFLNEITALAYDTKRCLYNLRGLKYCGGQGRSTATQRSQSRPSERSMAPALGQASVCQKPDREGGPHSPALNSGEPVSTTY